MTPENDFDVTPRLIFYQAVDAFEAKWQLKHSPGRVALEFAVWSRMYKMPELEIRQFLSEYKALVGDLGHGSVGDVARKLGI